MPIETKEIKKGLLNKGFIEDQGPHKFLRLTVNGRITGIKTWLSHGSKYKDYDDSLLNLVKRELRLDTKSQLMRLIKCPLEYKDYISYLKTKGLTL